jgi:hypothetical protein
MTLKELKKRLKGYPPDTEIPVRYYDGNGWPHDLPCREDCEIISSEQNATFLNAIILEADMDFLT